MHKFKNDIIVGAVVLIAILLSIFGYFFIREIPIRTKGIEVVITFNNVTGLTPGDAVTVSGVKIGRVKDIELKDEYVAVNVWLNSKILLPRDSQGAIRSIGMIEMNAVRFQIFRYISINNRRCFDFICINCHWRLFCQFTGTFCFSALSAKEICQ